MSWDRSTSGKRGIVASSGMSQSSSAGALQTSALFGGVASLAGSDSPSPLHLITIGPPKGIEVRDF